MDKRVRNTAFGEALCGLLACLALQAGAASRAGATCGDWLAHPADDVSMTAGDAGARPRPSDADSPATQQGRSDLLPVCPCRGPQCQRDPSQRAPAAPVVVSQSVERLAVVGCAEARPDVDRCFLAGREPQVRPERGHWQRIDHPPRA
jgi:hypothetical protein